MSVSGINFSGLSTGIDTNQIIQQLLSIDKRPQDLLKTQVTSLQQKQTAYNSVSAALLGLQAAGQTIDRLRAFDLVTATSTDDTVATVTAATGAPVGTHSITVSNLARAQRISTTAQTSQTAPLNFTGQILVNGKAVNVQAADSLQTLASNINAAQAGVTAAIITPSSGQYYLTLNSNNTGLQGKISLSDTGSNTFLSSTLGFFGATSSLKNSVSSSVAGSGLFADSATSVATLEGQSAVPPSQGSVSITATVGGTPTTKSVNIDLSKSLSGIAADINTAFGNPTTPVATVVAVSDPISGASKQQLQISGVSGAGAFTDSNNVLTNLGILQRDPGTNRELTAAKDAVFNIDGLDATRATNSFSDAISGVTIKLLKDTGTTDLNISSDTATIKSNITAFVKAFNDAVDSVSSLSQYDSTSGKSGPLFGDSVGQNIVDSLVANASGQIPGLPSSTSLLSQIGITLDGSNHLAVDDSALTTALQNNLQGVAQLFRAYGTPSDPTVQFVSSTSDTQPSSSTGYQVVVTQAATQATVTAGTAQSAPLASDETLTFAGPLFGTGIGSTLSGYNITLHQGSSLSDVISQINGDPTLGKALSASSNGGKLTLTSKQYGSSAQFAVVSAIPGASNTSGLGTTILQQQGKDVVGTINGETATGNGQFLLGSQQNLASGSKGHAMGLQLRVTATAPGTYGSVVFTSGVADILNNYITSQTDGYNGALTDANNQTQSSIDDLNAQISDMTQQLQDEQDRLTEQFSAMETSVSQLKASSAGLSSLLTTA